jgi:hypothetical protein
MAHRGSTKKRATRKQVTARVLAGFMVGIMFLAILTSFLVR